MQLVNSVLSAWNNSFGKKKRSKRIPSTCKHSSNIDLKDITILAKLRHFQGLKNTKSKLRLSKTFEDSIVIPVFLSHQLLTKTDITFKYLQLYYCTGVVHVDREPTLILYNYIVCARLAQLARSLTANHEVLSSNPGLVESWTLGDLLSPHCPWTGPLSHWSSLSTFYQET